MDSNFDGEVVGMQFGYFYSELLVIARQSDNKVIVSRVRASDGNEEWTYALDFSYSEPPMMIDYHEISNQGHHSLATKVSTGGFAIARLRINIGDGALQETKLVKLTSAAPNFNNFNIRGQKIKDVDHVLLLLNDDYSSPHYFHMV
jgi:hypothetical protein